MGNFDITEIGLLPSGTYSYTSAVNGRGDVVGWADTVPKPGLKPVEHAFYRDGKTGLMTDLHLVAPTTFDGPASRALDINESDQVVGWAQIADGQQRGFLWSAGAMEAVPVLPYDGPGSYSTVANAINDFGAVVGTSSKAVKAGTLDIEGHAFLWHGIMLLDLTPLGSPLSFGEDVNNFLETVGAASFPGNTPALSAFYWSPTSGGTLDLDPYGTTQQSFALAISDNSLTVGEIGSPPADKAMVAFPFVPGLITTFLGPSSDALDINDYSQVVGQAQFAGGPSHAFLSANGTVTDLNTEIDDPSGWELLSAVGISNNGDFIVGNGKHNGHARGFLLSRPKFRYTQAFYPADYTRRLIRHWFDPGPGPILGPTQRIGMPPQQLGIAFAIYEMAGLFSDARLRDQVQKESAKVITLLMQRSHEK